RSKRGTVPEEGTVPGAGNWKTRQVERVTNDGVGEPENAGLDYFLGGPPEVRSKLKEFEAPAFTSAVRVVAGLYGDGINWLGTPAPFPSALARCLLSAASV